jgi:quercetin dioxygenase-like cupin family protein
MEFWDTNRLAAEAHKPEILSSSDAARVIAIDLPAGEQLQEHRVHERTWLFVLSGDVQVSSGDGTDAGGGQGMLVEFEPKEPHELTAKSDARILLFLAPWPGEGHPGAMELDEKAKMRDRARERADEQG